MAIPPQIRDEIQRRLDAVAHEHGVRILYANESGSRAWGFPSQDSDYDVRFIYAHPLPWYVSVAQRRDVIELPIQGAIDVKGWDARKALGLFRKSNPPMLEWLHSPIVYRDDGVFAARLRTLLPHYYSRRNCLYHYASMARGNIREYLKGDRVWTKKYFYVLRPLLACRWIESRDDIVPTEFAPLVEACAPRGPFYDEVRELIRKKLAGMELDDGPRIAAFHDFFDAELPRIETLAGSVPTPEHRDPVALDRLLLETVGPGIAPSTS